MSKALVKLIVWYSSDKGKRTIEVTTDVDGTPLTHQAANRLARGLYSGMRTKVVDKRQRPYSRKMRSYSDKMAQECY